jgi:CMP-2-keto-3-deoxyoctulosonic acid synthetase
VEQLENLEQLRVLGTGNVIQVGIVEHQALGVDTYEDYEQFVKVYRQMRAAKAA